MRPVSRGEVLGLQAYEEIRPHFRARLVQEKAVRRVVFGGCLSVLFENRDTVLLQIQEMLRTERITAEPAILHEIETYNELVPGDGELSLTLFVEVADAAARAERLRELALLERHVWLELDGERVPAVGPVRHEAPEERTTAVHYLKAKLPDALAERLRAGGARSVAIVVDHPRLAARAELPAALVRALGLELAAP